MNLLKVIYNKLKLEGLTRIVPFMEFCARLICWTNEGWPSRRIGHKMSWSWRVWGDMMPEIPSIRTKLSEPSQLSTVRWIEVPFLSSFIGARDTVPSIGDEFRFQTNKAAWRSEAVDFKDRSAYISVLASRAPSLFMLQGRIIWNWRKVSHAIWRCSFIFLNQGHGL